MDALVVRGQNLHLITTAWTCIQVITVLYIDIKPKKAQWALIVGGTLVIGFVWDCKNDTLYVGPQYHIISIISNKCRANQMIYCCYSSLWITDENIGFCDIERLFFYFEKEPDPCAFPTHVTELESHFMYYSKRMTVSAHSSITMVLATEWRYYHFIWMVEYWQRSDICIKTWPGLQSCTCLFNGCMLFIKSPFFLSVISRPDHNSAGDTSDNSSIMVLFN